MGRSWKYVAAWMLTTAVAVTVSTLGVQLGIAPALTAEAPVAIDANRRYTELRFGTGESAPAPVSASPRPTTEAPKARPSKSPTIPPRSRTPATRPASPAVSPSATTAPARSPTPSPTPDERPRYRIPAEGGAVTVAYSAARLDVVDTDPLSGYVVSMARRSDTLIVIRLATIGHASVITAYWNGGPAAQVMEEYGS
jgi:hypothetical protein